MMTAIKQQQGMLLTELLEGLEVDTSTRFSDVRVSGLALDSRRLSAGDLFMACVGANQDGRTFIPQAIARGAVAVLIEEHVEELVEGGAEGSSAHEFSVPVICVQGLAKKLSLIAGRFYQQPSEKLPIIAVTGTNGKTSCTQLMMQLLNHVEKSCAVIGTLGVGVDGVLESGLNTTPDAVSIQQHLSQWSQQKLDCATIEVSSHGLEQGRVEALNFDVAVFTNLSRDHLDYHGDMESYGAAKSRLFQWPKLKTAVLNADDDYSIVLKESLSASVELLTYSLINHDADITVREVGYSSGGVQALVDSPWGQAQLTSALLGGFNLGNLLAAVSALSALGYSFKDLIAAAAKVTAVAGRMELIAAGDVSVVIDYSHTPDALEQALVALRAHTEKQLHCVFGCGGDRDKGKRPLMGEVAGRLADVVWLTSDNPRNENPEDILAQVLSGVECGDRRSQLQLELDRAEAIERAILSAEAGDVVLLAGKGHEDYQQVGERRLPFNDAVHARLALAKRAAL